MARHHHHGTGAAGAARLLMVGGSVLFAGLSVAAAILAVRGWDPMAAAPSGPPSRPAPAAAPAKPPPQPPPAASTPAPAPVARAPSPPEAVAEPPAERKPAAPVPPPPPPEPAPASSKPAPEAGDFAVQLGAFPSQASAEQTWAAVSARQGPIVNGRAHRVVPVEVGGRQVFRLLTTGFASPAEAQSFCRRLKSAGQDCFARP